MDLENLDATIVQFDPDYHVEAIRPQAFRPSKDWSNRGEMCWPQDDITATN